MSLWLKGVFIPQYKLNKEFYDVFESRFAFYALEILNSTLKINVSI